MLIPIVLINRTTPRYGTTAKKAVTHDSIGLAVLTFPAIRYYFFTATAEQLNITLSIRVEYLCDAQRRNAQVNTRCYWVFT